ncbi:YheC/YheD family protein [Peribacillus deserti]|uniref:ATP-grasp domain-containing protein n=1 Tax=Peribacillus deserti TaxID=673318 RepID=A0A2N5M0C0_9BACI|nr:YheC/YheD family protein [Peribacillus deserti]PLT27791.1 hypothetical protein CUU66_22020 [Peribacillus deserti]
MFNLKINKERQQTIKMSAQTLVQLNISTDHIILHFGQSITKLEIVINNVIDKGTLIIPQKISNNISIPEVSYHFYFQGNHLYLGPVIGFLPERLFYNNPKKLKMRLAKYNHIKGLIFIFRKKNINKAKKTIRGLFYDPVSQSFIKGSFPYPSAIFTRVRIKNKEYSYLKEQIGDRIFNYPYDNVDKFKFWQVLSQFPEIKKHLPYTEEYTNTEQLIQFLSKYESLYLKPVGLSQGRGIYHLKHQHGGFILTPGSGTQLYLPAKEDLAKVLKAEIKENYIIQEEKRAVPGMDKIDFRIYLQKDLHKKWNFSIMEARLAKKGSVITNSSGRQKVLDGKIGLSEIYGFNKEETNQITDYVFSLCKKVLNIMENNSYHLGDAAFDFIIDKDRRIWLLEVQLNYGADKRLDMADEDKVSLPFILPTPFEYAKALAGFNRKNMFVTEFF